MASGLYRERVGIRGGAGQLSGEIAYGDSWPVGLCLLLNPHPLMGGRMTNNVIERLATGLAEAGLLTLRFDYRGVGESEGQSADIAASMAQFWATDAAPEDAGFVSDGRAALGWLRDQAPGPLVIVGYSFGAYVAASLCGEVAANAAALISPTIKQHAFDAWDGVSIPKLVIWGDDDFAATPAELRAWLDRLGGLAQSVCIPGGQHFFRDKEQQVLDACCGFLRCHTAIRFTETHA